MTALSALMPAYWPSLQFFWNAAQCRFIILTDHFQYSKRSSATVSAPLRLSQPSLRIPVRHLDAQTAIAEKQFAPNSSWHKKHLQTLRHQFHHAPYAYYYLPDIQTLLSESYATLGDFLFALTSQLFNWLHFDLSVYRSSQLVTEGNHEQLLQNWCTQFQCDTCLTEPSALEQGFIRTEPLIEAGISCRTFLPVPDFHILQSNSRLSVLNFLMDYGPEAGYIIRQYLSS